jgi:putative MFS transporter
LGTASVQFIVIAVFGLAGLPGVLAILVGLLLFQAVIMGTFGVETKGRALEAISLTGTKDSAQAPDKIISERVLS